MLDKGGLTASKKFDSKSFTFLWGFFLVNEPTFQQTGHNPGNARSHYRTFAYPKWTVTLFRNLRNLKNRVKCAGTICSQGCWSKYHVCLTLILELPFAS